MFSAVLPVTDIERPLRHVRLVPFTEVVFSIEPPFRGFMIQTYKMILRARHSYPESIHFGLGQNNE